MRRYCCLLLGSALLAVGVQAAEVRPLLELEEADGTSRLWVRLPGETGRQLLRETAAPVDPGTTGSDPAGEAFFATWTERDSGRWFSYRRDGATDWSEGRPLRLTLRLRDGATAPGDSMPAPADGLALPAAGRLFLVQLRTFSLPEWRGALEDSGAELLAFFPHNAHIVRMAPSLASRLRELDFVERVEAYHPSYRLEPELRDWIETAATDARPPREERRVRAVVFEWGPSAKARVVETAEAVGARVADYWPSGHILELWVDRDQLRRIAAHDDVVWIDRWTPAENDMDLVREDAGTNWLDTGFGYCGQGVRGEVLDSGIQDSHPDFAGILLHGNHDIESHGTSTYGIVFGSGSGNAQATGHMPCAQGIFGDYENMTDRFAHTQELKGAPYFASFQSNSWGGGRTTAYTSLSQQMDDIIWRLDIAITQSQSNAGNRNSRPQAWAKNVISVGGIRHYNTLDTSDDAWANGASIGPAADGRIKPDVHYWYDSIFTTTTGGYTAGFC